MNDQVIAPTTQEAPAGGRVFFSNVRRSLEGEDEIILISVGVDIGSSTSHLVFSRLVLERLDNRYIVSERTVLHESDVLLTPYAADQSIDAAALGAFIETQYAQAGIEPDIAITALDADVIKSCVELGLGVGIMACPTGLHMCAMAPATLDERIESAGMVAFLADAKSDDIVMP